VKSKRVSIAYPAVFFMIISSISCELKTAPPEPVGPSIAADTPETPPTDQGEFSWLTIDGKPKNIEDLRSFLENRMKDEGISGLSVIIKQTKSTGTASYRLNLGAENPGSKKPIDDLTVFRADRFGQLVMAYIVLQFATYGQFDIDKPLRDYLTDMPLEGSPFRALQNDSRGRRLTARMILSQQSGLSDSRASSSPEKIEFIDRPGKGFLYSETAFALLRFVLEKRFKLEINEIARRLVFEPFHMKRTSFVREPRFEGHIAANKENSKSSSLRENGKALAFYTNVDDALEFVWLVTWGNPFLSRRFLEPLTYAPSVSIRSISITDPRLKAERGTLPRKLSWCLGWGSYFVRWIDLIGANFLGQKSPNLESYLFTNYSRDITAFIAFIVTDNPKSFMPVVVEETLGKIPTPLAWLGFN